jgi:hypothetical protein
VRFNNSRRRVSSRPVVITVLSIPARLGRTGATRSAAATTAGMTVFQPTPKVPEDRVDLDVGLRHRHCRPRRGPGQRRAGCGGRGAFDEGPQPSTQASSRLRQLAAGTPVPATCRCRAMWVRRSWTRWRSITPQRVQGCTSRGVRRQQRVLRVADGGVGQDELGRGEQQLAPPLDRGSLDTRTASVARWVDASSIEAVRVFAKQLRPGHALPRGRPHLTSGLPTAWCGSLKKEPITRRCGGGSPAPCPALRPGRATRPGRVGRRSVGRRGTRRTGAALRRGRG